MSEATPDVRGSGEFERYGLLAAVTLVVLCMLLADRFRSMPRAAVAPAPDKLLRVRIGGYDSTPHVAAPAPTPANTAKGPAQRPGTARDAVAPPVVQPAAPVRTCVIGNGETLGDIALRELGSSKRAREIADLNGITDPRKIRSGQTLRLPPR